MSDVQKHTAPAGELSYPLSAQQAYEAARSYFSRPGAVRAVTENGGTCLYRTHLGDACAVGCLIPDSMYSPLMEGESIDTLTACEPDLMSLVTGDDRECLRFLEDAQNAHDNQASDPPDLVELLDNLADRYGLDRAA